MKRGEIWLINFNPNEGNLKQKIRPGLIIQNDIGNQYSPTTIVALITPTPQSSPLTVEIERIDSESKEPLMINLAQIVTLSKDLLIQKIGEINKYQLELVDKALKISLGLF